MHSERVGPSRPRRVALLGSTGSIGQAALDVIARLPEKLRVFAIVARSNLDRLIEQTLTHQPAVVGISRSELAGAFRERTSGRWQGELIVGESAPAQVASLAEADVVLNGWVGAAGLLPSRAALRAGKPLALANKESLVIAGGALLRESARSGAPILPVDSEHSGIFQLLLGQDRDAVDRIVLTASGGPFRTRPLTEFSEITPAEALRHPTWAMGPRITVDSATLLNKGFEVLEAHWLFGLPSERIEVWIHPQSIVHGLVEWRDGSTTAQLSVPDMRIPIQIALTHPERPGGTLPRCDLTQVSPLEFGRPDPDRYPCLELARRALAEGATAPAVLNAADEVAVEAFLDARLPFPEIPRVLARLLDERPRESSDELEAVLEADAWARRRTAALLGAAR